MKHCPRCLQEKSLDAFARSASICRECDSARAREWRQVNAQRVREYRLQRRDADNARRHQSRLDNYSRDLESQRKYRNATRIAVFEHYGTVCACCGGSQHLTIDHVDGNGDGHRRDLFGSRQGGIPFYTWLIANGFPGGYQTLCRPCNTSKFTGGQCRLQHSVAQETGGQFR